MSGAANCPETPRQKMIGMMYLVLTAMLALNVAADVLNGFTMVNDSLRNTLETSEQKNAALYNSFEDLMALNPIKAKAWKEQADIVKEKSDSLYNLIEDIKVAIAVATDGPEGTPDSLLNPGNLDAAGQIGQVNAPNGKAMQLRKSIDEYSADMQAVVETDSVLKLQFAKIFDTNGIRRGMPWQAQIFESMPSAATITVLSKIQNDVRTAESEAVNYLRGQIDAGDMRVNKIEAKVIPVSQQVVKDYKYSAEIILAASDSTAKPKIIVDGREIPGGKYEVPASTVGARTFSGKIIVNRDGKDYEYPFSESYTVNAPSVTVSAKLMNVFYAGFNNPIGVSVPGVSQSQLTVAASSGTITPDPKGGWIIKPSKPGQNVEISVSAMVDGKAMFMGKETFRVKPLPPPVAFVDAKDASGNQLKYKGGGKAIAKKSLLDAPGLKAELDDADLDVKYSVLGFDTNAFDAMGNSITAPSDGASFSERQRRQLSALTRGKKLFITNIRARGQDGIERTLPPIEIAIQ